MINSSDRRCRANAPSAALLAISPSVFSRVGFRLLGFRISAVLPWGSIDDRLPAHPVRRCRFCLRRLRGPDRGDDRVRPARGGGEDRAADRFGRAAAGEVPAEILARDADGRFDRYFYQLLAESGLPISPLAALSLMIGTAAVAGGMAFVGTENLGPSPPRPWSDSGRRCSGSAGSAAAASAPWKRSCPAHSSKWPTACYGGQTLEQAAESVSMQIASPLKEEFGHCVQLLKMGQSPVAVMDRLSRRIPAAGVPPLRHGRAGASADRRQPGATDRRGWPFPPAIARNGGGTWGRKRSPGVIRPWGWWPAASSACRCSA